MEPATIALLGAMVLMLVGGLDAHKTLREIEWSTLFFFVGLFILVEALVATGIVGGIADRLAEATRGDSRQSRRSACCGSRRSRRPSSTTSRTRRPRSRSSSAWPETGMPVEPLWWALALGACLGGNLTIVGASANVVVANVAQRAGHPIRFVAVPPLRRRWWCSASLVISTVVPLGPLPRR